MDDPASVWFVRQTLHQPAHVSLLCAPHVGAGGLILRTWFQDLPEGVALWAIEFPGRGRRIKETPYSDLRLIVDALADAIVPGAEHTTAGFDMPMFPVAHFFIHEAQPQVLKVLGVAFEHALLQRETGDALGR